MDLRRHVAVLWRFRLVVACGVLLGVVLAVTATFKVTTGGLEWRQTQKFSSDSTLFVTQGGFPWGRATLPESTDALASAAQQARDAQSSNKIPPQTQLFADPGRFSGLASIYSYLVRSRQVIGLIPQHPKQDQITAEPFMTNPGSSGEALPVIGLRTQADTPQEAVTLNNATVKALVGYIKRQQDVNNVPDKQRVEIAVLNEAGPAFVSVGRSMTGAIVALLLCSILAVAVSYVLENLFPRWDQSDEFDTPVLFSPEPTLNGHAFHDADADGDDGDDGDDVKTAAKPARIPVGSGPRSRPRRSE
jgi:hypothetical protein